MIEVKPKFVPRPPESPEVIEARWKKKKFSIENLSNNIRKLKVNVTRDIQSDDEKDALTALIISVQLNTAERIGNDESAKNNHLGVTGFTKSNVDVKGNTVSLDYTGKSGVHHEKCFTDERVAKYLKRAIKNSPSKYVFETSEGFRIKSDRVARYLRPYGMKSKDIRGFLANSYTLDKLKKIEPEENDKKRKQQLNKILKSVSERVGHGRPTLKKHYLVPELWDEWVERGKIIDLKDMGYLEKGGSVEMEAGGKAKSGDKRVPVIIKGLVEKFEEEGISCDIINHGACMDFAEELKSELDGIGIKSEILSDGFFFDPFGDTPKEELESTDAYGKTPKNFDVVGLPSHYWVYSNGKHYDSDAPNGVDDMFELPTIKNFYKKHSGKKEMGGEAGSDDVESERTLLNKAVDEAESKLQEFIRPHKQASGLIPSEIKESSEYKELKRKFDAAFNELREFNAKNKSPKRTGYNIKKESGGELTEYMIVENDNSEFRSRFDKEEAIADAKSIFSKGSLNKIVVKDKKGNIYFEQRKKSFLEFYAEDGYLIF